MRLKKTFISSIVLLLVIPLSSTAAPIYLNCTIHHDAKDIPWELSLDEQAKSITINIKVVPPFIEPARFWSDRVQWGVNDAYTINRSDLSLKYVTKSGVVENGQCELKSDQGRKF